MIVKKDINNKRHVYKKIEKFSDLKKTCKKTLIFPKILIL